MNLLIGFSPFIAFVVLEHFFGVATGLAAAALMSLGIVLRDALMSGRHVKLLEVGSLLLFGFLGALAFATGADWSVLKVRLWVDLGLCAIVLASVVAKRPFTLPYAKERVSPEIWSSERFLRVNQTLTLAWVGAFIVIVLADLVMLYIPAVPLSLGIAITIASLVAALKFSGWYPARATRDPQEQH